MGKKSKAIAEAKAICADNRHGYSQANRNGHPDYDCSSFVIHCLDYAGYPVKKYGASYTGNMIPALRKAGFINVTSKVNLKTGAGLLEGDVLLNDNGAGTRYNGHTALMVTKTMQAAAHSNRDGRTGDSSGKEICVSRYSNYPWTSVWRPPTEKEEEKEEKKKTPATAGKITNRKRCSVAYQVLLGRFGNLPEREKRLKAAGYDYAKIQPIVNDYIKFRRIVRDVINGGYGNGEERAQRLKKAGYDPDYIQMLVNGVYDSGGVINGLI